MPLYEYECEQCAEVTEVLQRYSDDPPRCSDCRRAMKRQISCTNFSLKGSGWYKDSYGLRPSQTQD